MYYGADIKNCKNEFADILTNRNNKFPWINRSITKDDKTVILTFRLSVDE